MRKAIIVKFFKKCDMSNALYGCEDHLISEEENDGNVKEEEEEKKGF